MCSFCELTRGYTEFFGYKPLLRQQPLEANLGTLRCVLVGRRCVYQRFGCVTTPFAGYWIERQYRGATPVTNKDQEHGFFYVENDTV